MTKQDVRGGCEGCTDCNCGHKTAKPKRPGLRERYYRLGPDARWSICSLILITTIAMISLAIDAQTGYLRFMQEKAPHATFRLTHDLVTFVGGGIVGIHCTYGLKKSEC